MADDLKSNALSRQRVVRVFISSTFCDMHEEREELVKRIFPQLRKMCEQRGITWCEVDLRWGISDEQKAEGKVLPICLEEIKRCRPFFIGLLGERYGWVPKEIPQELIEQERWLAEHREKSVTELEIMHGVLKNPAMADHACFYLRDPAYVEKIPADKRADFVEKDSRARQRLSELKGRIRASGLAVRENYPDPQALGRMVLEDLTAAINLEFPPEIVPEPLDREAAEHEAFALSRVGIYIGRQEYIDRLDSHAMGDGQPLVILGESGVGKSALLANWALKYRESHSNELLLMHFIGASSYSADWAAMLRRIMGEFKCRFDIQQDIPDKPDELRDAFANWLHMAAAKGKIVLILDALNQLEDKDNAPDLVWLPPFIPENIRLVVSTLPGRPLDNLQKRDWPSFYLKPLKTEKRKKLIIDYLAQYRKTLDASQADFIASTGQTANPLYLRALLEELRVFGEHERLGERIDHYLGAATIPELYGKILERYEQDYERERPGLVKDVMSLIWASRRGLSEAELLEMLGKDSEPLPRAYWSPLYLAADKALVNRSGLIGFSHEYFREAVRGRYLPAEKDQASTHLSLADYFEAQEIGPRKIDELPWQLAQAESWGHLYTLLSYLPFFEACWENNQFELKFYWAQVEASSNQQMTEAYISVVEDPWRYEEFLWSLSRLFHDTGHLSQAMQLYEHLVACSQKTRDYATLQAVLGKRGNILSDWGQPMEAMALYKQQEQLCRKLGNKDDLQGCICDQANIISAEGRLKEAMELYKQQEQICLEVGNKDGLQRSLGNQAFIFYYWDRLKEAMALYKQQEQLCRELGNQHHLQLVLGNEAIILRDWSRLEEAMTLHKQQEKICREIGDRGGLQRSFVYQIEILCKWGLLGEAIELQEQAEQICGEMRNKNDIQRSLGTKAMILKTRGCLEDAMALYKQQEQICREISNNIDLMSSLTGQASILYALSRLEEAMELYKQQEQLCRELGNKASLQASLQGQANIYYSRGDLDRSEERRVQTSGAALS
jgi:tetratricopeptide (TPR) repeat protein